MSRAIIKTPCIGLCSTVYGDLVCRGCKRFHHEIVNWNLYGEEEKRAVWLRLESLLVQVMRAPVASAIFWAATTTSVGLVNVSGETIRTSMPIIAPATRNTTAATGCAAGSGVRSGM